MRAHDIERRSLTNAVKQTAGSHSLTAKERIFMPRLTEQEQQEIVRFIEADRPLPEKYRFLLFED